MPCQLCDAAGRCTFACEYDPENKDSKLKSYIDDGKTYINENYIGKLDPDNTFVIDNQLYHDLSYNERVIVVKEKVSHVGWLRLRFYYKDRWWYLQTTNRSADETTCSLWLARGRIDIGDSIITQPLLDYWPTHSSLRFDNPISVVDACRMIEHTMLTYKRGYDNGKLDKAHEIRTVLGIRPY